MKDLNELYEPTFRRRKVMKLVRLLYQLGWAKTKRDTEVISELEEEVAGVDADVLKEAHAWLDEIKRPKTVG